MKLSIFRLQSGLQGAPIADIDALLLIGDCVTVIWFTCFEVEGRAPPLDVC